MSSMRYSSLGVMRPPKPPCWRDFVASSPKSISIHSDCVDVADPTGRTLGIRSPIADVIETPKATASLPGTKPSRLVRRPRPRIHRTKSEHIIHPDDLPAVSLTDTGLKGMPAVALTDTSLKGLPAVTLTDTGPKGVPAVPLTETGSKDLHVGVLEGPRYVEENNKRCQSWLAGILAAEPLDEVGYTGNRQSSLSIIDESPRVVSEDLNNEITENLKSGLSKFVQHNIFHKDEQQQDVDVEVPEETFVWDASKIARHKSSSSDEDIQRPCNNIKAKKQCHKNQGINVPSRTTSSTHSHVSLTSNPVYVTCRSDSLTRCLASSTNSSNSLKYSPIPATSNRLSPTESASERPPVPATNNRLSPAKSASERPPVPATNNRLSPAKSASERPPVPATSISHGGQKCEILCGSCRAAREDCHNKVYKLNKTWCDHRKVHSSSNSGCSRCVSLTECSGPQFLYSVVQPVEVSPKDLRLSKNSIHTGPSSSELFTELSMNPKLINDSELRALNVSYCD